ncbi:MAG: hypothetical protein K6C30_03735, partial [Bacteroidaceae bacterium]|nr:hypothetical protein [Bacteroidaceae bacterium]
GMTFELFVKNWTRIYKPMQHDERRGNKRFFLTDGLKGLVDFVTQTTNALSPCVVMESNLTGTMDEARVTYVHTLYFFVHAVDTEMSDGVAASKAKQQAMEHATEFVKYMRQMKEQYEELRGLKTDMIPFDCDGPEQNGWYACRMDVERVEMLNNCIDQNNYVQS